MQSKKGETRLKRKSLFSLSLFQTTNSKLKKAG